MARAEVRIELGAWDELAQEATPIRHAVFVQEQGVPVDIELDEWDPLSLHAIARDGDGRAIGTGRLLPDGHIGRMAVRKPFRRQGVGRALLDSLVTAAIGRGLSLLQLHAQTHAEGFYAQAGFVAEGDEFGEAGIPHRRMARRLPS